MVGVVVLACATLPLIRTGGFSGDFKNELAWRRSIGPGGSSFAVRGGLIYAQEQRSDDEVVACYSAATTSAADTTTGATTRPTG